MYIVPDRQDLQFPQISQGYFSLKGFSRDDKLKILCNWICYELTAKERNWLSIREELKLEDYNNLEFYFYTTTGLNPQEFADYWKKRDRSRCRKALHGNNSAWDRFL